ncbi:uncharacterized protein LOC123216852 [Mangifera indica]|uniref:uncharacterized protein LOC123216852 n=1 Tax=Mangifera indica TaxID=29780 RepID=UPI001CFB8654|nr:uncharacterized protein LOC123216852 [Mangifera indica]
MSPSRKAWFVAASIGTVEALKDQVGICRWNYAIRSLQQRAKNNLKSFSQAKTISSSSKKNVYEEMGFSKVKKSEAAMDKVMELNCWGPSTVRF